MSVVTLPRIQIPLTVGGDRVSPEWYRWAHDTTIRIGGVTAETIKELSASVAVAQETANQAEHQGVIALGVARSARQEVRSIEVPEYLWHSMVARIARLERHVAAIEEMPL